MQVKLEPSMTINLPEEWRDAISVMVEHHAKMVVEIREEKPLRSSDQNALYHCLIRRLCECSGADEDYMKSVVMQKALDMGYPFLIVDGEAQLDDEGNMMPVPSTNATVKEFSLLIEACYTIATDCGFSIEKE